MTELMGWFALMLLSMSTAGVMATWCKPAEKSSAYADASAIMVLLFLYGSTAVCTWRWVTLFLGETFGR